MNTETENLILGDVVENHWRNEGQTIDLDVYRYLIDPQTKERSGYLRRERMRTLKEVFKDLRAALDVTICPACKHEIPREHSDYGNPCKKCGTKTEWFIDEYLHGPLDYAGYPSDVPKDYGWLACYAVTGGNEGHYVHVEFMCQVEEITVCDLADKPRKVRIASHGLWKPVRLALAKTFKGMEHAQEIARRCALLLGA